MLLNTFFLRLILHVIIDQWLLKYFAISWYQCVNLILINLFEFEFVGHDKSNAVFCHSSKLIIKFVESCFFFSLLLYNSIDEWLSSCTYITIFQVKEG